MTSILKLVALIAAIVIAILVVRSFGRAFNRIASVDAIVPAAAQIQQQRPAPAASVDKWIPVEQLGRQ